MVHFCIANIKTYVQQNAGAVTPPAGFTDYLGVTSSSAYSITSSDYFNLQQVIEGYNVADLRWGTANAKTVTLSFWVRSSLTGTFGGALQIVQIIEVILLLTQFLLLTLGNIKL
jgi:hypothetical protein